MRKHGLSRLIIIAGTSFAFIWVGSQKTHAGCVVDSDCPDGFSCSVLLSQPCGPTPCVSDGGECSTGKVCEPFEIRQCTAGPCEINSDCPKDMACRRGVSVCTTSSLPGSTTSCEKGPNRCVPKYKELCTQDADCGEGFRCVESHANCAVPPSADAGDLSGPYNDCANASVFACDMLKIVCEKDKDCPAAWTCKPSNTSRVASDCVVFASGRFECEHESDNTETTSSASMQCFPPYSDIFGVPDWMPDYEETKIAASNASLAAADKSSNGCQINLATNDEAAGWAFFINILVVFFLRQRYYH